ncbi:hypothetical protein KCV05_g10228, partial [Aureobasidium melanogenum]
MDFPFPECPGPEMYIEAERDFAQPPPNNEPPGPITIRWMTTSNYPGGSVWIMQILTFEPGERIFDRMTYDDNKVYWSQDTRTHLTREATCTSPESRRAFNAGLPTTFQRFGKSRGN